MWIVRELARLLVRIGIAVLIAIVIAELRALINGGDTTRTFQVIMLVLGALYLLLAGTGTGGAASRRVNLLGLEPKPADRHLTPAAVFIGSGAACLAIGLFV